MFSENHKKIISHVLPFQQTVFARMKAVSSIRHWQKRRLKCRKYLFSLQAQPIIYFGIREKYTLKKHI